MSGPWDHRQKGVGCYELRFNGQQIIELMFTRPPEMAATLVREMCDGMNAGFAARHPADDRGAEGAAGRETVGTNGLGGTTPSAPEHDQTPPQWREVINTPEAAAEWAAVHAVEHRTYRNGAGLAHQAYLDEVMGRPDITDAA